jgi:hypothetical protein
LTDGGSFINPVEVRQALLRSVLNYRDIVSLGDADVIPAFRLHLRQDGLFRRAKVNAEGVPRLHEVIQEGGGLKAAHETRQSLPSRLYAKVADCLLFGLAAFLDSIEDSFENLAGGRLLIGEHRTILYVVETTIRCARQLCH